MEVVMVVVIVVEAVTVVEVIKAVMVVEGTVVEVELPALDESVSNEQKGTKDLKAEESLEC